MDINRIPVKCVDNPEGFPGVIVYGDQTFPFSNPQCLDAVERIVSANEQGPNSSVRPIQSAQDGEEDTAVD